MRRRALLAAGLVAAACAPLACRKRRRFARFPGSAPPGGPGLRLVYELRPEHAPEPADSREALVGRTVEVLSRRVASLTDGGVVRPSESGGVEVFLPQGPAALYEAFRRVARVEGRFKVALVDDGSLSMIALAGRMRDAPPELVEIKEDRWTAVGGRSEHIDLYLAARDRRRLMEMLAADAARNPPPVDREFLLERWGEGWRSYYVIKGGGIDNSDIADASLGKGWDGQPELQVDLTPEGRRRFGDLTERSVGRKIVVVIDGTIQTAPVVASPILGGRVHVLTSRDPSADPALVTEEMEDLAIVLRSGPLPAPLVFMIEEGVPRLP